MRGVSLTLLLGLFVLAALGLAGVRLRWPPRALWRGVLAAGSVMTVLYLVWAVWKTFSLI
ncbi:hypothetical protein [Deinococcus planocerae]|uniref:hypothetical protein n=1 Tax=Deinococcus planocerae TaxID=1737569 RepID=UPI000C7F6542|nr:hypothetical protein [Deinococcus planocerae]